MKRLLILFTLLVVLFLSACAAADEAIGECDIGYEMKSNGECVIDSDPSVAIKSSLSFNWDTMTFTDTIEYDVFFNTGSSSTDYLILRGETINDALSDQQAGAYTDTLVILEEIEVQSEFSYDTIDQTTISEVYTYATTASVEVTTADVLTYNAIRSEVTSIKSTTNRQHSIDKYEYVELRLDITLTNEDKQAIDLLQAKLSELYSQNQVVIYLDTSTYEGLILILEDELEYVPPDDEARLLERGVELIKLLHDSK